MDQRSNTYPRETNSNFTGLLVAGVIIALWIIALAVLLNLSIAAIPIPAIFFAIVVQTMLFTGLFITAHDAIHGSVAPTNRRLNNLVGAIAVGLFALFSYSKLWRKHWRHHRRPASPEDPDFHSERHSHFLPWYFRFLSTYVGVWQVIGMAAIFNIAQHLIGMELVNLLLFWVIPSLLSTLQLFYFGVYRPHKQPAGGYADSHRAVSEDFGALLSFFTCYHFGYHWEHHESPSTPWWRLPKLRRSLRRYER